MHAASSPTRWMWGFRMVVWTGLLFLDHTGEFKSKFKGLKSKIHKTRRGNLHPNRKSTHSFQNKSGGSQGLPPDSPEPRARTPSRLGRTFSCWGGGETSKIRAWFRGRPGRCPSYLRVAFKVSVADCFDELLRDFNDVLLPHWQTEKGH